MGRNGEEEEYAVGLEMKIRETETKKGREEGQWRSFYGEKDRGTERLFGYVFFFFFF